MKLFPLLCPILMTAALPARAATQQSLLDALISHPGSYSQVCDAMSAPADIPYLAFEITDFAGASFSKSNQATILKNRDALVKSIRAKLTAIDLTRPARQPGEDPKPEENFDGEAYGCDPDSLNPLLLTLVQQLHAIETLPELLAVEKKLVEGIAKAKDDAKAKPPVVNGWQVHMESEDYNENEDPAKRDRRSNLFQARVAQRDLVMIMALLMREKSFEPYLNSELEKKYQAGITAQAKEFKLPKIARDAEPPKEVDGADVVRDPVTGLLVRTYSPVKIAYSRESRDEVRAAAEKWVAAHP